MGVQSVHAYIGNVHTGLVITAKHLTISDQ